jgi:hypothetical protein
MQTFTPVKNIRDKIEKKALQIEFFFILVILSWTSFVKRGQADRTMELETDVVNMVNKRKKLIAQASISYSR